MTFITDLRRRHRAFVIFMTFVFAARGSRPPADLAHAHARVGVYPGSFAVSGHSAGARDALGRVGLLRVPVQPPTAPPSPYWIPRSRASVQALLDDNRMRAGATSRGGLQAGFLVLLPLMIRQLKLRKGRRQRGRHRPVLVPGIFGVILLGLAWNHVRTLLPRKRELETLLKSYDAEPEHVAEGQRGRCVWADWAVLAGFAGT